MTTTDDGVRHTTHGWWPYRWLWACVIGVFVLDHLTKLWIVHFSGYTLGYVPPVSGTEVIPGFFNLIYAVNYGAAWGIGQGLGWLFTLIAVIVLGAIYRYRKPLELHRLPYQLAFGPIIGGIVGNALDRVLRGHVVDFLDFDLQFYRWPTFNIADMGIVVGTLWMLFFSQFLDQQNRPPAPKKTLRP
jgi:signal peptidase II